MHIFGSRFRAVITVILTVLSVDFLTKFLVSKYIPLITHDHSTYPYGGIGIFKNFLGVEFSIIHETNRGAAWGMFADFQFYLLVLRIILILAMTLYLLKFNTKPILDIPFALIIAGAVGNVIDFFRYGHVIDMLHFIFWGYEYPVFNVADSAIFLGICGLFLISWVHTEKIR